MEHAAAQPWRGACAKCAERSRARAVTGRSGGVRSYTCAMDEQIRTLIRQKLEVIMREEDAHLSTDLDTHWKRIDPSPHCVWIGDTMREVQRTCHGSITMRGARAAGMISKTLARLKPAYEKGLADELKSMTDPYFPEDLCLAASIGARGVHERRGDPRKFDERAYEHALTLARVDSANASRAARHKVHLAIDEYALVAKGEKGGGWDWLELKPNFYGIGVNLKNLFTRKRKSTHE